jgi:hypothetical protein
LTVRSQSFNQQNELVNILRLDGRKPFLTPVSAGAETPGFFAPRYAKGDPGVLALGKPWSKRCV